jgi:hypothetical protein
MSSIEDTWPQPVYDPGPPKHVHAIGVIALTYSTLQDGMDRLFLGKADSEWAEKYYYMLSEEKRSEAIREMFKDETPGVVAAIDNLVKYFGWCRTCRNNLLHAQSYPSGLVRFTDGALALIKPLKKGSSKPGYMALTLQDLRDIADRMQEGIVQCVNIHLFLRHRGRPEEAPKEYRERARSLPPNLPIPKPITLAPSFQDL